MAFWFKVSKDTTILRHAPHIPKKNVNLFPQPVAMTDVITLKNYRKLALIVAQDSLSYCCFDTLNHRLLSQNEIKFAKYKPVEARIVANAMKEAVKRPRSGTQVYHYREIMELNQ